ncbi:MAG: alpha/beta fold hydrolase [Pseudomonadota bacterium]|jgi:pimeloyl-[acyl-carrier protein] methyl ester esterase
MTRGTAAAARSGGHDGTRPRCWWLLPGWGFSAGVWEPLLRALPASLSARAMAPFTGESGRALAAAHARFGDPVDASVLAERLFDAWLGALRQQAGEPPIGLVGWSMGAQLAAEWARRYPDEVGALVLVAATPRFVTAADWPCAMPAADFAAFSRLAHGGVEPAFARLCALSALGEPVPAAMARRLRALRCADAEPGALVAALALLGAADLRAARAWPQPTVLLQAEGDAVVSAEAGERWAMQLPAARCVRLPAAGHAAPLAHADRVRDAIISLADG